MKNILFLSFIKYKTINVHDFYADILRNYVKDGHHVYFLIVGGGTEFEKLQEFFNTEKPENMKLMSKLPKDDYDRMVAA